MREPFFEEYEMRIVARVAAPMAANNNTLAQSLLDTVEMALRDRKDMLVAVTSITIEPVERKEHERSKTGF